MKTHLEMYRQILKQSAPAMYQAAEALTESEREGYIPLEMTSFVFAPLAVSFCRWALREAESMGLKRLYFLSRDGYQFYRCADVLAREWNSPVEVRYLYVSRYSLRIPCFSFLGEEALSYICLRGMEVTFLDMMERAGLSREEAKKAAGDIGYTDELTRAIPLTEIPKFREKLKDSRFFMSRMAEISREAFQTLEGYLTQEGLLEALPWGIVDSGWTGTTQQILTRLLREISGKASHEAARKASGEACYEAFHGFYFGLFDLPREAEASRYHTWYFSWRGNLKRKAEFSNSLFEAVFSAPHGMVTGYRQREWVAEGEKEFAPLLLGEKSLQAEEMETQTERILRFTELWLGMLQETLRPGQLQEILRLFMSSPEAAEAEFYGNYRFSDDVTERRTQPVALLLSEEELRGGHILEKFLRLYGSRKLPVRESAWYEGSAALYSHRAAWHQRHYRRYKKLIYIRKAWERKLRK